MRKETQFLPDLKDGVSLRGVMKSIKLAALAAFLIVAVLAVVMPTLDAMEADAHAKAEQERIASEAEAAWQETYGQMTDEERLQGVVYEE